MSDEEITDRLFLPMLLEATRVLEEKIVREPADVDHGADPGDRLPSVPRRNPPLVRQSGRGRRGRAAGAVCTPGQTVRADRDAWLGCAKR